MYLNIVKYNKWMNDLKSIILQANAGSGKTTAIVNRVVQLLLIENNWQKILCITFTKAAAYEMENRILDYLFYLKNTAADDEIIEKFKKFIFFASNDIFSNNSDQKKQYNNNFVNNSSLYKRVKSKRIIKRILYIRELFDKYVYNKVRIYTIHAFAQYVLQNLLVLPVFDIIDDLGMKKICYNIFNDIAIEFSQFFQGFSNGLEIIEYIIYNIDLFEHEIDLSDFKLKIASDSQIESYHMQILEIKNQINHEKLNVYNSIYDVYKIKNIFLTLNNRPRKTMIINLNSEQQKIIQESILIVYNYLESKKCMKDTAMLNKLGQRVRQKFISYKNTQSKLTFDDLIKKVVENRDIIDGYLHAGINHVLIDESQDTSVVQWQLIDILVQNYLFDIHKTIFIVGDSKQLIYSFQNANIVFFQNYLNRVYELSCENNRPIELINLNNNYRSGKAIIEFVNMFFDHSICVNDQYSSRVELWPIMSKKSISSKINSVNVKQGSVNCNKYLDDDGPFAELNVNLYDEICDYIFKLVQDENKDYKDIMVLFRNRSQNMHNLIETMNKKGIPNSGHDKMCIKDHMIVKLLIVIAKFVLLPYDDYNLVELLKSRLFNLNDAQIYYIKSCIVSDVDSSIDDNIDDQHCLQKTIWFVLSNRKEFVDIFKVLNCFLLNVDMDLSSFFYNVIYRNNLINLFQYLDSCNTVEFFLDIVNKYLLSYDNSLYSFVDWFSDNEFIYKKDNINVDYVLISTVHGVKGMESSVVIIADSTRVYINSNALIKDANNNVFIKNSNSDYIRNIISNSKSDEEEESQRLLYVAMTRAKDILIIAGSGKVMNGSWYHYLYDMVSNRFSIMNRKNYKYFVLEYEGMDRYGKNADSVECDEKVDSISKIGCGNYDVKMQYDQKIDNFQYNEYIADLHYRGDSICFNIMRYIEYIEGYGKRNIQQDDCNYTISNIFYSKSDKVNHILYVRDDCIQFDFMQQCIANIDAIQDVEFNSLKSINLNQGIEYGRRIHILMERVINAIDQYGVCDNADIIGDSHLKDLLIGDSRSDEIIMKSDSKVYAHDNIIDKDMSYLVLEALNIIDRLSNGVRYTESTIVLNDGSIGIIDLLIFEKSRIYIIDYKTDSIDIDCFADIDMKYKTQMRNYLVSVRNYYKHYEVEGYFFWFYNMKLIKCDI